MHTETAPLNTKTRTYLSCSIYPNLCVFGAYSCLWTFCCNYVWSIYSNTTPTMDRIRSSNGSFSSDCTCHALSKMLTWDQALLLLFCFFGSLAREGKNAWYIHLTSHQPPPYLHNLTSAWPVMLLANQRLPYGNQIFAGMSLSKSILGKRKF